MDYSSSLLDYFIGKRQLLGLTAKINLVTNFEITSSNFAGFIQLVFIRNMHDLKHRITRKKANTHTMKLPSSVSYKFYSWLRHSSFLQLSSSVWKNRLIIITYVNLFFSTTSCTGNPLRDTYLQLVILLYLQNAEEKLALYFLIYNIDSNRAISLI